MANERDGGLEFLLGRLVNLSEVVVATMAVEALDRAAEFRA